MLFVNGQRIVNAPKGGQTVYIAVQVTLYVMILDIGLKIVSFIAIHE